MAQDVLITPASTKIAFTDSGDTTTVLRTSSGRFEFKDSGESNFVDIYANDIVLDGNLTVGGTTTTVNTSNILIEDPILQLAKGQTSGSPTVDIGFVGLRGDSNNAAFIWDESADQFAAILTTGDGSSTTLTPASYAGFKAGASFFTGGITVENSLLRITSAAPNLVFSVPSGGLDSRIFNDGSGNFIIGHGDNSDTPTERLRINSSGSVGIGTASPGARLHVQGTESKFSAPSPTSDAHYLRLKYDNSEGIVDANRGNLKLQANSDIVYTSNKFGIGTNNPGQNLQIHQADSDVNYLEFTNTTATTGTLVGLNAAEEFILWHRHNSDMVFATNAVEKMRIENGGNVGIGTNAPARHLHVEDLGQIKLVNNSTGNWAGIDLKTSGGTNNYTGYFGMLDANGNFFIDVGSNGDDVIIRQNGETNLGLQGSVGIGTTSPEDKLHVAGNIMITDTSPEITLETSNASHYNWQIAAQENVSGGLEFSLGSADADATNDTFSPKMVINSNGNVGIGTNAPAHKLEVSGGGGGTFGAITNRQSANANTDGIATVSYDSGNQSLRLWVDASGNRYLNAGTTAVISFTTTAVDIKQATTFSSGRATFSGTAGADGVVLAGGEDNNYSSRLFFDNGTAGEAVTILNSNAGMQFRTLATPGSSSGTTRMYLNSAGNLGIGTSSPAAKLHIQSDGSHDEGAELILRHSNNNTTDIVSTISFQNNGGQVAKIESGTTGANNTGYISFFTENAGTISEKLRVLGNGNIGIGRTTAHGKLDILAADLGSSSGDVSVVGRSSSDVGSNTMYLLEEYVRTSAGSDWTTSGVRLQAKTDSTYQGYIQFNGDGNNYGISFGAGAGGTSSPGTTPEKMRIASTGNVSIGSNSSGYGRLFVDAATTAANTALAVRGRDASADYLALNVMNNADSGLFAIYNSGKAYVSGSVGIGTTSPDAKIRVSNSASSGGTFKFTDGSSRTLMDLGGGVLSWNAASVLGAGAWAGTADHEIKSLTTTRDTVLIVGPSSGTNHALYVTGLKSYFGGSVGIGTTAPEQALHVNSAGTNFVAKFESTDDKASILIEDDTTLNYIHSRNGYFSLGGASDAGASNLNINSSNGNVGIGTTSPTSLLHVNNSSAPPTFHLSAAVNQNSFIRMTEQTNHEGGFIHYDGSANVFSIGVHDGNDTTSSSDNKVINISRSSGSVGIGTTSPTAPLHVNGNIKAERSLIGISNSSLSRIEQIILDSSGEDLPVINYQLNNDLALLRVKGNTVTYGGLSSNPGDSETDRFFESNSYFGDIAASEISNASTGFTITLDSLPRNLTYTTRIGISFAAAQWRCSYVKIEVYRAGAWTQIREETSNTKATVWQYYNTGSSGITKIRYTIKTPVTTSTRIVSLFAFNYNSTGNSGYFLSQAGGTLYGALTLGEFTFPTTDGTANQVLQTDGSGTLSWSSAGTGTISGSGTDNYIPRFNGTGALENSAIYDNGSVGIGTTSPTTPLHVVGNTVINGDLFFGSTSGSFVTTSSSNLRLSGDNGIKLQTYSGGWQDRLTIIDNGNVGIGTTSPSEKLHVDGAGYFEGGGLRDGSWHRGIEITTENNNFSSLYFGGQSTTKYSALVWTSSTSGNAGNKRGAQIFAHPSSATNTDLKFSTNNAVGTSDPSIKMVIRGDGKVGIGTDGPSARLHLSASDPVLKITDTSTTDNSATLWLQENDSYGAKLNYNSHSDNFFTLDIVDSGTTTERFVINRYGNVGIGTTSPAYPLDVRTASLGAMQVKGAETHGLLLGEAAYSQSNDYTGLKTSLMTGAQDYMIISGSTTDGNTYVGAKSGNNLHLRAGGNNSTNEIVVSASTGITYKSDVRHEFSTGSVGIGTSSPSAKLHVNGGSNWNTRFTSASTRSGFVIDKPGTTSVMGSGLVLASDETYRLGTANYYHVVMNQAGRTQLFGGGSAGLTVDTSGSVGIGTTSPATTLHSSGTVRVGTSPFTDYKTSQQYSSASYYVAMATGSFHVADSSNTAKFTFTPSTGKFGIGITSPNETADVVGSLKYGTSNDHEIVYHSTTGTIAGDTLTTINWKNGTSTLDRAYTYKIELYVNNDTSTNSSAVYVLRDTANYASDTVAWSLRMVSRTGTSSNHVAAVVTATSTVIQLKHFHPSSSYPIGYKVTANKRGTQNAVGAAIFGADSMWQRDVGVLQYSDGQIQVTSGAVGTPSYSFVGDVDTGMWRPGVNQLRLVTGGVDAIRIDGSQNVGIGVTPNTANKLEVNGQIRGTTGIFGDSSAGNVAAKPVHIKVGGAAMLRLEDSTSSNLVYDISSDWGIGFVIRDETAGTNRLIIDQSTGDATFSNDVIVTGDLTVNGDTTTVNTTNLLVEDPLIVLAKNQSGTPTLDAGIVVERGDSNNAAMYWDESDDQFRFITTTETGSTAGNIAITDNADIKAKNATFTGTLTESSSITLKENIFNFTSPLEKISKVRPVKYNKKTNKDKKEIGLIAEELAEIFPELVENDKDGNPASVNYTRAVTVLFDGFKQMYKELKEIKEKIK